MATHICALPGCNRSLEGLRRSAKFCSPQCRREAHASSAEGRADAKASESFWDGYTRVLRSPRAFSAVLVGLLSFLLLSACGSASHASRALREDGQTAPKVGAKGLHGDHVLFRGTSHCYVPPGQGTLGVCSPPNASHRSGAPSLTFSAYGEDVSNYQFCVNPTGDAYVIARGGEGNGFDAYAVCTLGNAKSLGIYYGIYWFYRTYVDPGTQAYDAYHVLADHGDLTGPHAIGVWLDAETNDSGLSGQQLCDNYRAFSNDVIADSGGKVRVTGLYSAPGLGLVPCTSGLPHEAAWVTGLGGMCGVNWLDGFPYMTQCQTSFGPGLHGGDTDAWMYGTLAMYSKAMQTVPPPPIPPTSSAERADCKQLGDRALPHSAITDMWNALYAYHVWCSSNPPRYTAQPPYAWYATGYDTGQCRIAHSKVPWSVQAPAWHHISQTHEACAYLNVGGKNWAWIAHPKT